MAEPTTVFARAVGVLSLPDVEAIGVEPSVTDFVRLGAGAPASVFCGGINARSARMAETLALPAAQTSERCTVCHSPFQSVAPSRLTSAAQVDEGVSCENCHTAAGPWLRGHTRTDWTYATRVSAGMRDLRNFYVRANTCVACHQNLEPDLTGAGHPELTFELDGQSVSEPKHWREDDPSSGPRAWLVGQAVALREMSWALAKNETADPNTNARWNGLA